jgi:hypothetical protein
MAELVPERGGPLEVLVPGLPFVEVDVEEDDATPPEVVPIVDELEVALIPPGP